MLPNITVVCPDCGCLLRRVLPEDLEESDEDDYEDYVSAFGEEMHCDQCDKSFDVRNGMVQGPWSREYDEPIPPIVTNRREFFIFPSGAWRMAAFRLEDFVAANGPGIRMEPEFFRTWFSWDDQAALECWLRYLDDFDPVRVGEVMLSKEGNYLRAELVRGAPYWRKIAARLLKPRRGIASVEGGWIVPVDLDRFLKLLWVTLRRIYAEYDGYPTWTHTAPPPSVCMTKVFRSTRKEFEVTDHRIGPLDIRILRSLLEEECERLVPRSSAPK